MSQAFVDNNVHNFSSLLRVYTTGFIARLYKSQNKLVSNICKSSYFIYGSQLFQTWKNSVYIIWLIYLFSMIFWVLSMLLALWYNLWFACLYCICIYLQGCGEPYYYISIKIYWSCLSTFLTADNIVGWNTHASLSLKLTTAQFFSKIYCQDIPSLIHCSWAYCCLPESHNMKEGIKIGVGIVVFIIFILTQLLIMQHDILTRASTNSNMCRN